MTGKQILEALQNSTDIPFTHFEWTPAPQETEEIKAYGILTENRIEKQVFSNKESEEILDCDVDVFCYADEMDSNKSQVENVFDSYHIAYEFDNIDFEQESKLVHLTWFIKCIYCDGVSPLSTLYIHDLLPHACVNYEIAQVEDDNIIAENIKKDVEILGVVGTFESILPEYEGGYTHRSKVNETQTLETMNTAMLQNLTILPNEKQTIINPPGGFTFIIN